MHTHSHTHTQPHSHTHDGTAHAPAGVGRTCSAGAVQRSSSWDTAFCVRTVVPPARTTLTRQHFVPSDAVYEGQRGQRACRWNGMRSRQIHPTNAWFSMLANWRGLGSLHWHGQIKHKDRRRWGADIHVLVCWEIVPTQPVPRVSRESNLITTNVHQNTQKLALRRNTQTHKQTHTHTHRHIFILHVVLSYGIN